MTMDNEALKAAIGEDDRLSATFDVIEPYLPVLKRAGKVAVAAFLDAVRQQDWSRVDRALYSEMTESERDALGSDILKAARTVVKEAYETNRLWQEDLLKLSFNLLLSAI